MRILTILGILLASVTTAVLLSLTHDDWSSFHNIGSTMSSDDYAAEWKKVQEALDKGLPKSALEIVERIYKRAKSEKNRPQIIKAVAHRIALIAETSEDGEVILIGDIEKEIRGSDQPERSVFQSMLADLYWTYYQVNRWEIADRTVLGDEPGKDFRTWDAAQFFDTTRALYLKSLEAEAVLQRIPVREYKEILTGSSRSEEYRPTMFDILAHRALDFFENDEADLPKPTREFEITGLEALQPAGDFAVHQFETPDYRDPKYNALHLYQKLLRYHLGDDRPDALVDLDLQRLAYARRVTYHEEKDTAYFTELNALLQRHRDASISTQIGYEIARYFYDRNDYITAMQWCESEMKRFENSRGAVNCVSLRSRILSKDLDLNVEQTILPDAAFIISTQYRNIGRVHFRVIPLEDESDEYSHRRSTDEWLNDMLRAKAIRSWKQDLPAAEDYKHHRTDLKGEPLPPGRYLLIASAEESFALRKNGMAYAILQSTRLSLQSQTRRDGSIVFWVQDAESGKPIEGVTVNIHTRRWDSPSNRYEKVFVRSVKTGEHGSFTLHSSSGDRDYSLTLEYGKDRHIIGRSFRPWEPGTPSKRNRTIFFTDRHLYRPGQTVYFKGIVLREDPEKVRYAVERKTRTTVIFKDANYQKISEMSFTTNEYGSFNGSFTIPTGILTGMFRIYDAWGSHQFRVEEYKRPKFEVQFKPIEGDYGLNDVVKTTGTAKAYAGSNIDGAAVTYRVIRRARYPYWYWWWLPLPDAAEKEIAHGITRTDENGEFTVSFTAVPDKSIPRKHLPVFTYTVYADVTDLNGETRSGSTWISAGYVTLALDVAVPPMMERGERNTVVIQSKNLNGQPLRASGSILVEKLRAPEKIHRRRFLPRADLFDLSRDEFETLFPHDIYKDEEIPDTWDVEKTFLGRTFATDQNGIDSIALSDITHGQYRVTVKAKDSKGEDVLLKRFFMVYDTEAETPPIPKAAMLIPLKTSCAPGDTARFLYGTSLDGSNVLYQIEYRGKIVKEEWLTLNGEQRTFEIPIEEKHRGGVNVHVSLVHAYRLYSENLYINVPWSNKALSVETATFRDKLKPGEEEEWRVTIKGESADLVAAEMVATMYDASLDAIWSGSWSRFSWPLFYSSSGITEHAFGQIASRSYAVDWFTVQSGYSLSYHGLNLFLLGQHRYRYGRGVYGLMMKSGAMRSEVMMAAPSAAGEVEEGEAAMDANEKKDDRRNGLGNGESRESPKEDVGQVKARTNFNETAFFFPQLTTNEKGEVVLKFTMPEALTRWKMTAFAHTPDLKTGWLEKTTVTQKELMVMPNAPRFFREGDDLVFPIKITNMTEEKLAGTAKLMLFDAVTMQPVDEAFGLRDAARNFTLEKGRSGSLSWNLHIPEGMTAVVYRVVAKSGDFSDGEEAPLAVLPNRMLVTETLPLNIRGMQTRSYTFEKLVKSRSSSTLRHHKLTLEMTSNPAWYAVQALPYLMEFPYECSEQVFNRFYANSIASHLVNSSPKIKRVFEQWKGTDALLSNLQKNQELKALLIEETPWVMQGQNEHERKQRIALLFDLNTMAKNLDNALRKLEKAQGGNGGWAWFPGMPESRYITQYILAGFGHLDRLGIEIDDARVSRMVDRAVSYADARMHEGYERLKRSSGFNPKKDYLNYLEIQYLYARSYFLDRKIQREYDEAVDFWLDQARKFWVRRNFMSQGMIALAMHRWKDTKTADAVIASLREHSLQSDEMGMYWKYENGWFWYQAPIETQALLIEAFDEIVGDGNAIEEMKIWLLKQKQVQDWKTTVATAEACYALLRRGSDLLASDKLVEVTVGGRKIDPRAEGASVEAGTGHYQVSWNRSEIEPEMGKITLKKEDKGIAWGAMFWQYYEQLDKITPHETPLKISKKLYRQVNTDEGVVLEPINEKNILRVGDILKARIEIRVDRDMEYIHLRDMRGAGFEPINQLSRYRWQGSLGYYEAPKDASVNFFIHWLPKGVHVFEYPLRVSHQGRFSNGISSIQSMYAPEFASHTQGFVVMVE